LLKSKYAMMKEIMKMDTKIWVISH
jgi:hypothetical protein